jgi:hypothetical protein
MVQIFSGDRRIGGEYVRSKFIRAFLYYLDNGMVSETIPYGVPFPINNDPELDFIVTSHFFRVFLRVGDVLEFISYEHAEKYVEENKEYLMTVDEGKNTVCRDYMRFQYYVD